MNILTALQIKPRAAARFMLIAAFMAPASVFPQEPLVPMNQLSPDAALELAQASLASCRSSGFQVAVAVVDRMGVTQVLLRDRYAGPHTPDTAVRKAWTAVSFRSDTLSLSRNTKAGSDQSGARMIENALMIGGGVPVEAAGKIVGGIGISGAPSGVEDDRCARSGIDSIREKLELGN
jgi:uncharacterized protein GlcG (DUF336 family)